MSKHRSFAVPLLCLMPLAAMVACTRPVSVDTCYAPAGKCSSAIVSEIESARTEVLVQARALTSKAVMEAFVRAHEAGAEITVILDPSLPTAQASSLQLASLKGVAVFTDSRHPVAGNNVMIIDGGTVITGSMAFTDDAESRNAENLVIIRSPAVADSYRTNWKEHRDHAEEFVKIAGPQKPDTPAASPRKKAAKGKKKKTS